MIQLMKKTKKILTSFFKVITPHFIQIRLDAITFGIVNFIGFASKEVKFSEKILDAGAGSSPYKKYFSHAEYESTDFEDIFDKLA